MNDPSDNVSDNSRYEESQEHIHVLYVDDEPDHQKLLKLFLEEVEPSIHVESASSPREALQMMMLQHYDCVVSDYLMPEMDGIELVKKIKETNKIPFIIYTGRGSEEVAEAAIGVGIDDYVRKELNHNHYQVLARRIVNAVKKYKTEERLGESEERLRLLIEYAPDAIYITDLNGYFLDGNKQAEELTGYKKEELLGKKILEVGLLYEEYLPKALKGLEKNINGEKTGPDEFVLMRKDGSTISVEISTFPVKRSGEVEVISIARDITERKRYEKRLNALHKCTDDLTNAESIEDIYNITLGAVESVLGYTFAGIARLKGNLIHYVKVIGGTVHEGLTIPVEGSITGRAFKTGAVQLIQDVRLDQDFVKGPYDENMHEILSELVVPVIINGKVEIVINVESKNLNAFNERDKEMLETLAHHVASSISIIRQRESLKRYLDELERSNRELDDYTYVVSHDMKEPLRSITAFSEFLLEDYVDRLDEAGQDYLKRIVDASTRMDRFIRDLLTLSRVGRKYTETEQVDLNVLMKEIVSDFESRLGGNKAKILYDQLPTFMAQRVWMKQLLSNLISNGLKFNESAKPVIKVSCDEREGDYIISVSDNGIGIRKEDMGRLFKLFQRLHPQEEYPGTGAGLAICKKIVENFGGDIGVESKIGKGSIFYFTYPKEREEAERPTSEPPVVHGITQPEEAYQSSLVRN